MAQPSLPTARELAWSRWYRLGPVLIAAAVYLTCMAQPRLWDVAIWPQGLAQFGAPFVDMHSHLATAQAVARHEAVIGEVIPGDPMPRPYVGPQWLFWFGYLGLGPAHTLPLAGFCVAAFLVAAACVLRPRRLIESLGLLAVLLSPPVMLLVERGNVDLFVICALWGAFGLMARPLAPPRWGGWSLITAFIGFKYYPAVGYAGYLESNAGRREKLVALGLGLGAVALFLYFTRAELGQVAGSQYENRFYPFFGGRELWVMLGYPHASAALLGLGAWLAGAGGLAWLLGPLSRGETAFDARKIGFVGGASILVFCFVSGSSPDYRLVHFLPCLPWLWALSRGEPGAPKAARHTGTLCLVLFLATPWLGTLGARTALALDAPSVWWGVLFLKQFGWWALLLCLGALLLRHLAARGLELLGLPRSQGFRPPDAPARLM